MRQIARPNVLTVASLLMDASMSMTRFQSAPCDALNAFIRECREAPEADNIAVQITAFAATAVEALPLTMVRLAPAISSIQNRRGTRLYATARDVMMRLTQHDPRMRNIGRRQNHVFAVFTDGEDVLSTEDDRLQLCELAAHAIRNNWDLLTFGFGVDARSIAHRMGFPTDPDHAKTVSADVRSIHTAVSVARERTVTSSRTGWVADVPTPPTPR